MRFMVLISMFIFSGCNQGEKFNLEQFYMDFIDYSNSKCIIMYKQSPFNLENISVTNKDNKWVISSEVVKEDIEYHAEAEFKKKVMITNTFKLTKKVLYFRPHHQIEEVTKHFIDTLLYSKSNLDFFLKNSVTKDCLIPWKLLDNLEKFSKEKDDTLIVCIPDNKSKEKMIWISLLHRNKIIRAGIIGKVPKPGMAPQELIDTLMGIK